MEYMTKKMKKIKRMKRMPKNEGNLGANILKLKNTDDIIMRIKNKKKKK
jgi:hypothetical protein